MKEIYHGAKEVVIWIGEEKEDSADATTLLKTIHTAVSDGKLSISADFSSLATDLEQAGLPGYNSHVWRTLGNLYSRDWFSRVWVIQELAVAASAAVSYGGQHIPWVYFEPAANCIFGVMTWNYWDPRLRFDHTRFFNMCVCHTRFQSGLETRLLDLLSTTRSNFSTDPRDKLFALLGLAKDADTLLPSPDYSRSIVEIYSALVIKMIFSQKSLDVLSEVEDSRWTLIGGLPSWAVDWSAYPRSRPLRTIPIYETFRAAGDTQVNASISLILNTLIITGFCVDKVQQCGDAFLRFVPRFQLVNKTLAGLGQPDLNLESNLYLEQTRWQKWELMALQLKSYPTGEDLSEAYHRTLAAGVDLCKNDPPHGFDFLYRAFLKSWGFLQDTSPIICGTENAAKVPCTHWTWYRRAVEDAVQGRRLFTTGGGYMGLGPPSTRSGDVICILLGAKVPCVLRPVGKGQWRFVGECYLHGAMYRHVDDVAKDLQDFAIR